MDLLEMAQTKTRLETAAAGIFREVGFAADFAAVTAKGGVVAAPACFLVQTGETSLSEKEDSGPLRQYLAVTLSALICVMLAGLRGGAGLKALETPIAAVRAAFFGWKHPDADLAFRIGSGGVEDFDTKTGLLVYRLDFVARVKLQAPA